MGHGVFRLYQGAPSYNHSQIALDAEKVVKMRYPDYPLVSDVPALYGGGYPMLCRMIMIRNTSNGTDERVVVDAFTLEIVPDHPSEDYKGSEYAWSVPGLRPSGRMAGSYCAMGVAGIERERDRGVCDVAGHRCPALGQPTECKYHPERFFCWITGVLTFRT